MRLFYKSEILGRLSSEIPLLYVESSKKKKLAVTSDQEYYLLPPLSHV